MNQVPELTELETHLKTLTEQKEQLAVSKETLLECRMDTQDTYKQLEQVIRRIAVINRLINEHYTNHAIKIR